MTNTHAISWTFYTKITQQEKKRIFPHLPKICWNCTFLARVHCMTIIYSFNWIDFIYVQHQNWCKSESEHTNAFGAIKSWGSHESTLWVFFPSRAHMAKWCDFGSEMNRTALIFNGNKNAFLKKLTSFSFPPPQCVSVPHVTDLLSRC